MNFDFVRVRITKMRKDQGISKAQMASQLGMEERNYERIECLTKGRHKHLDLDLLHGIAEALQTELWKLILPPQTDTADGPARSVDGRHQAPVASEADGGALTQSLLQLVAEQRTLIGEQRALIDVLTAGPPQA